jgi:hypothetical protein
VIQTPAHTVISRHRLPLRYRLSLALLWAAPLVIFTAVICRYADAPLALLDPRFILPAALMLLPAVYIWQEGVDVLPGGLFRRMLLPRYFPYGRLGGWRCEAEPPRRLVSVWDRHERVVIECRVGHLTDLPLLLDALDRHLGDAKK